jgi:RNA methyltransferase, TrmH family
VSSSIPIVTRAQAARVRNLLKDKQVRQADGAFIVEGAKAVRDLLITHPTRIRMLVVTAEYQRRENAHDRQIRESLAAPSYGCLDRTFATMSDLDAPQGILAVVQQPRWDEEEVFARQNLFGLYGERIQDPANVGAIIRTAAALNASALWLTPDSADVYNPKVVRATSGALLSLPVFVTGDATTFTRHGCAIFAAEAGSGETVAMKTIRAVPRRMILAVGNESQGLSAQTIQQSSCRFTIPLERQIESLNVAATVAIALYSIGRLPKEA